MPQSKKGQELTFVKGTVKKMAEPYGPYELTTMGREERCGRFREGCGQALGCASGRALCSLCSLFHNLRNSLLKFEKVQKMIKGEGTSLMEKV